MSGLFRFFLLHASRTDASRQRRSLASRSITRQERQRLERDGLRRSLSESCPTEVIGVVTCVR